MESNDICERLYYNITPDPGASMFLLFSSQLLGYEIPFFWRTLTKFLDMGSVA